MTSFTLKATIIRSTGLGSRRGRSCFIPSTAVAPESPSACHATSRLVREDKLRTAHHSPPDARYNGEEPARVPTFVRREASNGSLFSIIAHRYAHRHAVFGNQHHARSRYRLWPRRGLEACGTDERGQH